ncbi:MAG: TatD family hydrolase [Thermoplasmata archaeon]
MPRPLDLPIVDHHCHLSLHGEGVRAARRFAAAGGTHLFLATQNYSTGDPPTRVDDYAKQFETTEALARRVTDATGVVVYLVVAPYPIDLLSTASRLGLAAAVEVQMGALELAGRWVDEQRAVALGEVGRPHFPVSGELGEAAETVFRHALEVARDVGCPAVVHCDDLDADGYRDLASFAAKSAFPLGKLVKHYARVVRPPVELGGIVPSYVARRDTVRDALPQPGPWFLETDFLDDPRRPGAVLDLATVPRRASAIAEGSADARDRLSVPFVESIRSVYGFAPTLAGAAP